jgi:hypothetical protein
VIICHQAASGSDKLGCKIQKYQTFVVKSIRLNLINVQFSNVSGDFNLLQCSNGKNNTTTIENQHHSLMAVIEQSFNS